MKFIKRTLTTFLILFFIIIMFRGYIFRHLITYKSIGSRTKYPATEQELINYINDDKANAGISYIIKSSLTKTSKKLNFTTDKNDIDPNKLIISKTAHCVGYASFFATTCNYLLEKHKLNDTWTAQSQKGQLYFLGTYMNQYFKSPFFKDHDFVTIEDKTTGEVFAVDPSVNDYLYIDYVTYSAH